MSMKSPRRLRLISPRALRSGSRLRVLLDLFLASVFKILYLGRQDMGEGMRRE
jgi:hypothetical protein